MNFKTLAFSALVAIAPLAAQAITIDVDAGGATDSSSSMGSGVMYSGSLGGWDLLLTASNFSAPGTSQLSSNAISAVGIGTLTVTTTETYSLDGDFLRLTGDGSVSEAATSGSVLVQHYVDFGLGAGFEQVGSDLDFGSAIGAMTTVGGKASDGTFDLRTIFTIVTEVDEVVNVNADVTAAPVPLPAAGMLLLGGLGGLAAMRRRKKS